MIGVGVGEGELLRDVLMCRVWVPHLELMSPTVLMAIGVVPEVVRVSCLRTAPCLLKALWALLVVMEHPRRARRGIMLTGMATIRAIPSTAGTSCQETVRIRPLLVWRLRIVALRRLRSRPWHRPRITGAVQ